MKRYIRASQRFVSSPMERLKSKLGIGWGDKSSVESVNYGKCNFALVPGYDFYTKDLDSWVKVIKSIGGKYVTKRHGAVYFYYDMSSLNSAYETEKKQAEDDYTAELNAMDIDQYKPDQATIKKIMDYRNRGSKVNVKAIKDINKALRYYYTAILIGWGELAGDIYSKLGWDYRDLLTAIDRRVASDNQYADTRSNYEKKNDLPPTNGLFTFEDKNCWLSKLILMTFVNNNVPVHFGIRTRAPEYDRHGRDWSEVEHLTLYPDSDNPIKCDIVVVSDEGMGSPCYCGWASGYGSLCNDYSSAKKLIQGLEDLIARRNAGSI